MSGSGKPGRRPLPREHGTPRGYRQHKRLGEKPCMECCAGEAADFRKRYAARKAAS